MHKIVENIIRDNGIKVGEKITTTIRPANNDEKDKNNGNINNIFFVNIFF